ncbi:MAG: Glu-tRNA(Gln) amidotransferase subunit GatE [Promethearchaeota archaeon]
MSKDVHDYKALGFKAGIEIHAQLTTKRKLFCHCPAILTNENPQAIIQRKFRPVLGEMGVYDPALLIEFKKDHTIFYEVFDNICTYELDETPPFRINDEALYNGVKLAKMMNCNIVEETNVCRKNYLDGSVPCGFQRTTLVGYNGHIFLSDEHSMVEEKKLPITWVYIEEDAARKDNDRTKDKNIYFKLDRLGIPLIEIVTHYNLYSPTEVIYAARSLGMLIKSSGIARKGLGTLRQDINVSIIEGARVELKGIQLLQLIPIAIDIEIQRQKGLIAIKRELQKRNIHSKDIPYQIHDVTDLFNTTSSKLIRSALKRKEKILMLPVPGFQGLLSLKLQPDKRFGTELSDRVKSFTNLKGLIHSDEDLTEYNFSSDEIQGLKEKCHEKTSAFILIIGDEEEAERALSIVHERLLASFDGVPQETRHVDAEGISSFTRDLHGRSRLYPDTDLPSIVIDSNRVKKIEESLPEFFRDRIKRMSKQYSIPIDLAEELVYEDYADIFEELVAKGVPTKIILTTLTQTLIMIAREGVNIDNITEEHLMEVFDALKLEKFAKEAIPNILTLIGINPNKSLIDIISESGGRMTRKELDDLIINVLNDSQNLIKERGMNSFSPLMGLVMKKARGKIDGKLVSEALRKRLKEHVTR